MNPDDKKDQKLEEVPEKPVVLGDVRRHRKIDAGKILLVILLILALAGGAAAYRWRDQESKDAAKAKDTEITSLKNKIAGLEKQLSAGKTDSTSAPDTTDGKPSQTMIDNIKAVFATGNTQPLSTYMMPTVKVIIAASEGLGDRTPEQATADIESFMKNATVPWSFSIPEATLAKYRAGSYKEYFSNNAVIGKSSDLVIAFSFDNGGKIKTVFMTNAETVLFSE